MELKEILSISGKPGLYKLLSSSKSSVIVESLVDGKRMPVHAAHKISALDDISVYTYSDDVLLGEVFQKIREKEGNGTAISHKASSKELKAYMKEVFPEYDEDRVYDSDLRKLFQWFNLLQEKGFFEEAPKSDEEE